MWRRSWPVNFGISHADVAELADANMWQRSWPVNSGVSHADVAELADAPGLGPGAFTGVGVRVPPSAPKSLTL